MIIYLTDRALNIVGHASTSLPGGIRIIDDNTVGDVDTGVNIFEGSLVANDYTRTALEEAVQCGRYILKQSDRAQEGSYDQLYQIVDTQYDTATQELHFYAEDAGLELINSIAQEMELKDKTLRQMLREIIPSDWDISINEESAKTKTYKWDGESTVTERARSIANLFGYELYYSFTIDRLKITSKTINLVVKRGVGQTGYTLQLGRELSAIRTIRSIADLATAFAVKGNGITLKGYSYRYVDPENGDVYEVDATTGQMRNKTAMARWASKLDPDGLIVKTYSYETKDKAVLAGQARAELQKASKASLNYEADVVSLPDNLNIGDRVYIVDPAAELYLDSRLLKLETSESRHTQSATFGEYLIVNGGISEQVRVLLSEADATQGMIAQAQTLATEANELATSAQESAVLAQAAAAGANDTAEAANQLATSAQATATLVKTAVVTAQETAEAANELASSAQTAAEAAGAVATTANLAASNAQATADAAINGVERANERARLAAQVATRYITDVTAEAGIIVQGVDADGEKTEGYTKITDKVEVGNAERKAVVDTDGFALQDTDGNDIARLAPLALNLNGDGFSATSEYQDDLSPEGAVLSRWLTTRIGTQVLENLNTEFEVSGKNADGSRYCGSKYTSGHIFGLLYSAAVTEALTKLADGETNHATLSLTGNVQDTRAELMANYRPGRESTDLSSYAGVSCTIDEGPSLIPDGQGGYYSKRLSNVFIEADNVKINQKPLAAHIVESGTKNGWYYEIWSNGKREAWKQIVTTEKMNNSTGGLYGTIELDAGALPDGVFTESPRRSAYAYANNENLQLQVNLYNVPNSTTQFGHYRLLRGNSNTSAVAKFVNLHCVQLPS